MLTLVQELISICKPSVSSGHVPKLFCYCDSDIHIFHDLALYCEDGSFFFLWLDYVNEFSKHGPRCDHLRPGGTWSGLGCRKSHWSALAKAENSCHFPVLFMLLHCRARISLHLALPSAAHENSKQFFISCTRQQLGV